MPSYEELIDTGKIKCVCGHVAKNHNITNMKQLMKNKKTLAKIKCKYCDCKDADF